MLLSAGNLCIPGRSVFAGLRSCYRYTVVNSGITCLPTPLSVSCADPESFVRGGPALTAIFS